MWTCPLYYLNNKIIIISKNPNIGGAIIKKEKPLMPMRKFWKH